MIVYLLLPALAGLISVYVVRWTLRNAARLDLVQVANHRSSHKVPTPAGGGLGIVAGTAAGSAILCFFMPQLILPLLLGLGIAALGFADDRKPIGAKWRLLVQALGVGGLVFILAAPFLLGSFGLTLGILIGLVLVGCGMWWVNLYNFLDGIDGYASAQALCMLWSAILVCLLLAQAPVFHPLILLMMINATAIIGFLIFNWPPAKIFMGDAGSTFLGFWIFAIAIFTVTLGWMNVWQWLILSTLFLADASVTLARRLLRGDNVFIAHRDHAYQKLARKWGGHYPVLRAAIWINVIVMLPCAVLAGFFAEFAMLIAIWLLGLGAIWAFMIGAGQPDKA